MKRRAAWAVVLLAVFAGSGCGMVKDFRKNRHLKAAEKYVAEKKWKEATIEYRNALRFDPQNLTAVKQLGLAYYENGQLGEAYPPLKRYHDQNVERPRGAAEAGRHLPDGPRARQGPRAGARDPGEGAAQPGRAAPDRRVRRHAGGNQGRDRAARAGPGDAAGSGPRGSRARRALRAEPGRSARRD